MRDSTGKNIIIVMLMLIMYLLLLLPAPLKEQTPETEIVYEIITETIELREFRSVEELEYWLFQDKTNHHTYIINQYDCDDFAYDLVQNAIYDGYFFTLYLDNVHLDKKVRHLMCAVIIGGSLYVIEPQNDTITLVIPLIDDDWY